MGLFSNALFPSTGEAGDGGGIIQVKIEQKTGKFATNSTSYTDVSGFYCSITPKSSSNKILVITSANFGAGQDLSLIHI